MQRLVAGAVLLALLGVAARSRADAPLREDRIRFIAHDLVAGQISAADLGSYLDGVQSLLHGSQNTAIDVPTCTEFGTIGADPPVLFTSDGGLADGLAVIENQAELLAVLDWGATQGDRVGIFVQDIQWCGAPSNAIGCAPRPGSVFVVALDAFSGLRPLVIAHERGHNAGLGHRSDDGCALMGPVASLGNGCLDQGEARAFYDQADVATDEACGCIDVSVHGPNQDWTLVADGTSCDDSDICTPTSSCGSGLCTGDEPSCFDGNLCTADLCDPVAGCTNPNLPEGALCDVDGDFCNGIDLCFSGVCQSGTPLPCDDGAFCNGAEGCHPQLGCQPGTSPAVDDGVACTIDSCDEDADLVVHELDPGTCDDGDPCTAESCDALTGCASEPVLSCSAPIPATSPAARALLGALLLASAGSPLHGALRRSRSRSA